MITSDRSLGYELFEKLQSRIDQLEYENKFLWQRINQLSDGKFVVEDYEKELDARIDLASSAEHDLETLIQRRRAGRISP